MIFLAKKELENYDEIGSGKFGIVYQVSDTLAYKIYNETILNRNGYEETNPALYRSLLYFIRAKRCNQKLKYTDLFQDTIYLDGRFGGVAIPYYPGCTLQTFANSSYKLKKEISKQLIRNNQELNSNFIYPTDYHLGNIIVVDGQAKIIDLDDPLTHISLLPNPVLERISKSRLTETLQDFFGEYDYTSYNHTVEEYLERKRYKERKLNNWLDDFFKEKENQTNYLLMDETSDLETVKELLRNKKYRIIYILKERCRNDEEIIRIVESLEKENIHVFDFIIEEKKEKYFLNFPAEEKVYVKKDPISIK